MPRKYSVVLAFCLWVVTASLMGCSEDPKASDQDSGTNTNNNTNTDGGVASDATSDAASGTLSVDHYAFWKSSKPEETGDHVFVAAADGLESNAGTLQSPWDLDTAFDSFHTPNSAPAPGDYILYLRGGIYPGGYVVKFNRDAGLNTATLTVRPYPGEIVVFDSTDNEEGLHSLYVNGSHITIDGFVFTSRNPNRLTGRDEVVSCGGVYDDGYNNRFMNNIIHDVLHSGIATARNENNTAPAATATDQGGTLLYGNIFFNCGHANTDLQGSGNTIYLQNIAGQKRVEHNLLFNSFKTQVTVYHSGNDIENVVLSENISFNAGAPGKVTQRNILVGSEGNFTDMVIEGNSLYHSPWNIDKSNLQVGYGGEGNVGLRVTDNVVFGGGYASGSWGSVLEINRPWADALFTGNLLVNHASDARLVWYPNLPDTADRAQFVFTANSYYMGRGNSQADPGETHVQDQYPALEVRTHLIEGEHRAYVAVFNFDSSTDVVTTMIPQIVGSWQVFDAENLLGGPVSEGSGTQITIPMDLTETFAPMGTPDGVNFRAVPHTDPEFGAYVVTWYH